jgi:hypothetical protein
VEFGDPRHSLKLLPGKHNDWNVTHIELLVVDAWRQKGERMLPEPMCSLRDILAVLQPIAVVAVLADEKMPAALFGNQPSVNARALTHDALHLGFTEQDIERADHEASSPS